MVNSPAIQFMKALREDASVCFIDPLVSQKDVAWAEKLDHGVVWNREALNKFDTIVLAVKQPGLDYKLLDRIDTPVERFAL